MNFKRSLWEISNWEFSVECCHALNSNQSVSFPSFHSFLSFCLISLYSFLRLLNPDSYFYFHSFAFLSSFSLSSSFYFINSLFLFFLSFFFFFLMKVNNWLQTRQQHFSLVFSARKYQRITCFLFFPSLFFLCFVGFEKNLNVIRKERGCFVLAWACAILA